MGSKYVDSTAIIQVIGCVYTNPSLLDFTDKYSITDEDFVEDIHKVIFGSIYKLHELGAKTISLETISDFLETRPKSKAIYDQGGEEWLLKVSQNAVQTTFDYYYGKMKKIAKSLREAEWANLPMDLSSTRRRDAHVVGDGVEILSVKIVSHEYLTLFGMQPIEDGLYLGMLIFAQDVGIGCCHIPLNRVRLSGFGIL